EDRLEEAWQRLAALAAFNWASTPQEQRFTERLLEWAQHPQQTTALLKQAAHELREIFARLPHPREQLVEDYQRVRETVLGNYAPPSGPQWTVSLNSLPGERRRALKALELLANQALNYVDAVVFVAQPNSGISLERQI